jgi:hypothetical protein
MLLRLEELEDEQLQKTRQGDKILGERTKIAIRPQTKPLGLYAMEANFLNNARSIFQRERYAAISNVNCRTRTAIINITILTWVMNTDYILQMKSMAVHKTTDSF